MSPQQTIIPELLSEIEAYHRQCSVVLIGSVANGTEREQSDVDLNIFLSEYGKEDVSSPFVDSDNRWQLRMKGERGGVRIDVAWETYDGLTKRLEGDGPAECWPFSNGKILRDPQGIVAQLLTVAQLWYDNHPEVARRMRDVYLAAKRKQAQDRWPSP